MSQSVRDELARNLEQVEARIESACTRVGRSRKDITLVAVTKKQALEKVAIMAELLAERSLPVIFGENYVQELKAKASLFPQAQFHLIGPLQRNKARDAVRGAVLLHAVHSPALAEAISKEAEKASKIARVLLQVNISRDEAKHGFLPEQVLEACNAVQALPSIALVGLMTITRLYETAEEARPDFAALRALATTLPRPGSASLELSMGMSNDFDVAIEEGATLVRVGTALFGER